MDYLWSLDHHHFIEGGRWRCPSGVHGEEGGRAMVVLPRESGQERFTHVERLDV